MAAPYDHIPEELRQDALNDSNQETGAKSGTQTHKTTSGEEYRITGGEKAQKRLFKKRRAGVVLSQDEVRAIKEGRKKLRKEMKARGIKSRREFELVAGGLGLYFDKRRGFWLWFLRHWLAALLGALGLLLLGLLLFAAVTQLRGHFTINMSDGMFREGFTLSETVGFENPTTQLFATPATNVPCISIGQIPLNIDEIDGQHNDTYFAYTYYIRNEGESTVSYDWQMDINSQSKHLSEATWAAVFEDGALQFYAKASADGTPQALPAMDDNSRGYITLPIRELASDSEQFQKIKTVDQITYYRVIPQNFQSESIITTGTQTGVKPMEVHKYTVVLWLEGDDPDTTDEMIGGHLGVEMNFQLVSEKKQEQSSKKGIGKWLEELLENLKFYS